MLFLLCDGSAVRDDVDVLNGLLNKELRSVEAQYVSHHWSVEQSRPVLALSC